ncbi:MAG: hypothetical protein DRR08_16145 [Candidatus Parabeggiatoa sp. nov. 2]|nr:MAG: hypothetical protein B6247_14750 [Beggiatoa sp. 4572_84]RKZ58540.1 MAG: hypothetical protein DRR08_16145 [Gammaproteobacteria bacterium]
MYYPFPGMDPYLENPALWAEVHHRLIVAIANAIEESLSSQYRVAIEKRIYRINSQEAVFVGIPDVTILSQDSPTEPTQEEVAIASKCEPVTVTIPMSEEVREGYLEIQEVTTGEVITVIDILSPKNKRPGEGRKAYKRKLQQVLESFTHFVEIDLLRNGKPTSLLGKMPSTNYRILVSREYERPRAQLYAFSVRDEIPAFPVPLQPGEAEPIVKLQTLLKKVYKQARYHLTIDYHRQPIPPLQAEDAKWAKTLLREN